MRILDEGRDQAVERAMLLLTRSEAAELVGSLQLLLDDGAGRHEHVLSDNARKEIGVAIYETGCVDGFGERCQRLIFVPNTARTKVGGPLQQGVSGRAAAGLHVVAALRIA